MRSPNHLEIKNQCNESIPLLMAKHHLGIPTRIVVDETGWVNPCFFVNDKFVFRFNARDPELPKYQREKFAFDLLRTSTVPVPQKVILDETKTSAPFDVLITEMIPGENLETAWPKLNTERREKLAENAGRLLKQMTALPLPFFGELGSTGPFVRTETWVSYLQAKLSFHLDKALSLEIFDGKVIKQFWNTFNKYAPALSEVSTPHLVHVDFHFGNLLFVGDQITGVVDFEWAFAGDPLYDLCRWQQDEEEWLGSRKAFLKGFRKSNFADSEIKRIKIYQMIRNIELCIVAKRHFTHNEAKSYRETTIAQMKTL